MIEVTRKEKCCGCEACVQACPRRCISFRTDSEGFYYPHADANMCVDCGLCERVCPMLHKATTPIDPQPFFFQSTDPVTLSHSSSGGLFFTVASKFIREGGVVAGATFNRQWAVEHVCVTTIEDLVQLCSSKYVQSRTGNVFSLVLQLLKEGKRVFFCGTPCQVKALRQMVNGHQEQLVCADFICHGVPSPLVWQRWLEHTAAGRKVSAVNFRSKDTGWNHYHYSLKIYYQNGDEQSYRIPESSYLRAYSANMILRPSCYRCPMRGKNRWSDFTMADFWGAESILHPTEETEGVRSLHDHRQLAIDKGLSLAFANNAKGKELLQTAGATPLNADIEKLTNSNISYDRQTPTTALRGAFFSQMAAQPQHTVALLEQFTHLSPMMRRYYKIRTFINKLIGTI